MTNEELEHLRKKALHTLEERRLMDERHLLTTRWQEATAGIGFWDQTTEEEKDARIAEIEAKSEKLRLKHNNLVDDNKNLNDGRTPAIGYFEALELIVQLSTLTKKGERKNLQKWGDRLSKEEAVKIRNEAKFMGDGCHEKDCFWRGYRLHDRFFIGLNDNLSIWEVDEENMRAHCMEGD